MIERNPKNVTLHKSLAATLTKKDDADATIAVHRKLIELTPKDAWAYSSLGDVLRSSATGTGLSRPIARPANSNRKNATITIA